MKKILLVLLVVCSITQKSYAMTRVSSVSDITAKLQKSNLPQDFASIQDDPILSAYVISQVKDIYKDSFFDNLFEMLNNGSKLDDIQAAAQLLLLCAALFTQQTLDAINAVLKSINLKKFFPNNDKVNTLANLMQRTTAEKTTLQNLALQLFQLKKTLKNNEARKKYYRDRIQEVTEQEKQLDDSPENEIFKDLFRLRLKFWTSCLKEEL